MGLRIRDRFLSVGFGLVLVFLLAVLTGYGTLASVSESDHMPPPKGAVLVKVLRVVDGDTIVVDRFGKVRYIGIDTPETKHPKKPVQWFGKEASAANRELILGKMVALEFDVQKTDRYGRTLAYVYVGDTFVNAALVEGGYAQVATFPPNVKYVELFRRLQAKARVAGSGLWQPPGAHAAQE